MLHRSRFLRTLVLYGLIVCLSLPMVYAQSGGKKGGGGGAEPPAFRLPPLAYEVDVMPVPGMGLYSDTNDYGVSAVSMRPDWDPYVPLDLRTSYRASAAALVFPAVAADGSLSSQVVYLDQEIDPTLENIDLTVATRINNQGHVLCLGRVSAEDGSVVTNQGFLLTPKSGEEAAIDGFFYNIEPLQMPAWAGRLTNATATYMSDAGYDAIGNLQRPNLVYRVGSSVDGDVSSAMFIHYSDGTFWEPNLATTGSSFINAFGFQINASGTTLVSQYIEFEGQLDYLLDQDGGQVFPQNLSGSTGLNRLHDLANNGYSCGEQLRVVGYRKVRGGQQPIYELSLTYHAPSGASYALPLRTGTVLPSGEWTQMNDQLVNQVPVVASSHRLFVPGYDFAWLRELMSPAEQLEYDGLRLGPSNVANYSDSLSKMTTPRTANGVDHEGAPSFYQGAFLQSYPDGASGFEGIYVIHGTRIPTP